MGAKDLGGQLERVLKILFMLPHDKSRALSKSAILEKLEITINPITIKRDLETLSGVLPSVEMVVKNGEECWYWDVKSRAISSWATAIGSNPSHHDQRNLRPEPIDRLKNQLKPQDAEKGLEKLARIFYGRDWLTKFINQWREKPESRLLWINGVAGIGKSAIAAHLIGKLKDEKTLVAYYFCGQEGREGSSDNEMRSFVQTLIYQLAEFLDNRKKEHIIKEVPISGISIPNLGARFQELIVKPLSKLTPQPGKKHLIVIDALDKADGSQGTHPLADLLCEFVDLPEWPSWLQVFVTSRPTAALEQRLLKFDRITIEAGNEDHAKDIEGFINYIAPNLAANDKIKLVETCGGSFLFVRAALDAGKCLDMTKISGKMNELLADIFKHLFPQIENYLERQEPILGLVAALAPHPLPESLGCLLLQISRKDWKKRIQPLLGNLIVQSNDDRKETLYEPFHRCLVDWMCDPELASAYLVDLEAGRQRFGAFLVRQMLSDSWPDLPPEDKKPVLTYLPEFVRFTREWDDLDALMIVAKRLHSAYQYWGEAPIVQRLVDICSRPDAGDPRILERTVQAFCQRAANYRCLGQHTEAQSDLDVASGWAERIPDNRRAQVAICRQRARLASANGNHAKGAKILEECIGITQDNPTRAELLNEAGRLHSRLTDKESLKKAGEMIKKSLTLRQHEFGAQHPLVGKAFNNLGYLNLREGKLSEAIKNFKKALKAKGAFDSGHDETIALAKSNLGLAYLRMAQQKQNKSNIRPKNSAANSSADEKDCEDNTSLEKILEEANSHLCDALNLREALFGADSIPYAKTLMRLAELSFLQPDFGDPKEKADRAFTIFQNNLGELDLFTLEAKLLQAQIESKQGRTGEAAKMAEEIIGMLGERETGDGKVSELLKNAEELIHARKVKNGKGKFLSYFGQL